MKTLRERFEAKVEHIPFSECALWSGATDQDGYGNIWNGEKLVRAHRKAHELYIGPIPDGMQVLHTCHNGHLGCVSPDHLYAGTTYDNVRDRVAANRQAKGCTQHLAKLSEADIPIIRARIAAGDVLRRIAEDYGVHETAIGFIKRRVTWKHVPEED